MANAGKLFVVATPIGNLNDISSRAIDVLSSVGKIYAEDTRTTKRLLQEIGVPQKSLDSFHAHSFYKKRDIILNELLGGKDLAIVSDAGTPGISDPGGELVNYIYEMGEKIKVIPIPGPSSVTSALSVSGFRADSFLFLGYVPKRKRQAFFQRIADCDITVCYFDSPFRVSKNLHKLAEVLEPQRKIFVIREISKVYEESYRGSISEVIEGIGAKSKGEFVIIVDRPL